MSTPAENFLDFNHRRVELPITHYWQLSEDWGIHEAERRRVCAPLCLKMVLDYKLKGESIPEIPLTEIINRTLMNGGRTKDGWLHAAEVATLKDYGLNAWRRDWTKGNFMELLAKRKERYDDTQMRAIQNQQLAETYVSGRDQKVMESILTALDSGNPVIASVLPGFSDNTQSHQVVISGYIESQAGTQLQINDPIIKNSDQQQVQVDWNYFSSYFHDRAIFVHDYEH